MLNYRTKEQLCFALGAMELCQRHGARVNSDSWFVASNSIDTLSISYYRIG